MSVCMKELRELVRLEALGLPVRAPLGGLSRLEIAQLFGAAVAESELAVEAATCGSSPLRLVTGVGVVHGIVNGNNIVACADAIEDGTVLARDWAGAVREELAYLAWSQPYAPLGGLSPRLGGAALTTTSVLEGNGGFEPSAVGFALWVDRWTSHGDLCRAAMELLDGEAELNAILVACEELEEEEALGQKLYHGASSNNGLSRGIRRSSEGWWWSTRGRGYSRWGGFHAGRKPRGKSISEKRKGVTERRGGRRVKVTWR